MLIGVYVGCFSAGFVANDSGSGTRVSLILELQVSYDSAIQTECHKI